MGPDIVLWRSNFQLKLPLSQQDEWDTGVPWHQDIAYFQPSPNVILSAWKAIDHVEKSNGCMQILSGSHKKLCPHIQNDGLKMFEKKDQQHRAMAATNLSFIYFLEQDYNQV